MIQLYELPPGAKGFGSPYFSALRTHHALPVALPESLQTEC